MEGTSSDRSMPKAQTIVLNVLSPSTEEIPRKLTFADLPISTTVRALKERIQTTVPAKPALPRQRLIYQGKVLASEESTLKDIFGLEAINRSEPLSLHLVLSPAPRSDTSTTLTTSNQNHATQSTNRQQWTPSPLPQLNNPSSHGQTPPPTQPAAFPDGQNVQHGPGQTPLLFPPPQMPGQQGQIPMPPHLQNALNSHLAAMNQQFAAHFAAHGHQQHLHQGRPHTHFQAHQHQQPILPPPSFQQILAQQQQARASAGQYGLSPNLPTNQPAAAQNGQSLDIAQNSTQNSNPSAAVRENQGPQGESFRVVIQSTTVSRPNSGMGQRPHSPTPNLTPQRSSTPTNTGTSAPPSTAVWGTPAIGNPSHSPGLNLSSPNQLAMFQQRLTAIENSLAGGTAPPQAVFDHARTYLDNMASQPNILPRGSEASLRTRLNNLTTQANNLRASLNSVLSQVLAGQNPGSRMTQNNSPLFPNGSLQAGQPLAQGSVNSNVAAHTTPTSGSAPAVSEQSNLQGPSDPSAAPDVYLLSSPAGPHYLLVHRSALYTTNLALPLMTAIPQVPSPSFNPFAFSQANPSQQAPHNPPDPQAAPAPPYHPPGHLAPLHPTQAQQHQNQHQNQNHNHNQNQQQQQQAQAQAQAQNQPRDLARILLPLGGHLWLLIRLFGFVYFFTAGGGHRRAILLGICAFIVFIANTGAFRPLFRAIWEPIRRHVEGLIPLAAAAGGADRQRERGQHQQPQQQGRIENGTEPGRNGVNTGGAATTAPNTNRPDPQALADRLIRDQANASLFRRAERAVAIFVASLVPGVGERHIAARDAAEARRLEEQREREARALEERAAQEDKDKERIEGGQNREEGLPTGPNNERSSGSSSGVDRGLNGTGEGSRGSGESMRERPLVEI
ncbi:MAG: hypothetical protein Q9169_005031 [Polycauliona sp. 2 TL-2023]